MQVGIFWVIADGGTNHLIIDGTSLSDAEPYGDFLTHPASHYDVWTALQERPAAELRQRFGTDGIRLCEYENWPRGRIVHHRPSASFIIYADRQLHYPTYHAQIQAAFDLPPDTPLRADAHYSRTRRLPAPGSPSSER